MVEVNANMKPYEGNHLAITRSVVKPNLVSLLPKAFVEYSMLPNFKDSLLYIYASPPLGAKFLEYEIEMQPGGKTNKPIKDELEHFLFVIDGGVELNLEGTRHKMDTGGYAWLPPGMAFELNNSAKAKNRVLWLRKRYIKADGLAVPDPVISSEKDVPPIQMDAEIEQRLLPFEANLGFDLAMNILTFKPGVTFGRTEYHVFEHGAFFLRGRGVFWINEDWYEVHEDDFVYFAAFVPHFVAAYGPDPLTYILYKDVNRDYEI